MESAVHFFAVKNCCPEDDRAANTKIWLVLVQLVEYCSDTVAYSTNNVSCILFSFNASICKKGYALSSD